MTLRKWIYLFWTTLLIGSAVGLAAGLVIMLTDQAWPSGFQEIAVSLFMMLLAGSAISVLSQMGFFAYLFVRYFLQGFVRKIWIQSMLQWILIIIALFDLVYLRYKPASGDLAVLFITPACLLLFALLTAWRKIQLTNSSAFTPTVFFMVVITAIEAVPALRENNSSSTLLMLLPLAACNAWQILLLHKMAQTEKEPA